MARAANRCPCARQEKIKYFESRTCAHNSQPHSGTGKRCHPKNAPARTSPRKNIMVKTYQIMSASANCLSAVRRLQAALCTGVARSQNMHHRAAMRSASTWSPDRKHQSALQAPKGAHASSAVHAPTPNEPSMCLDLLHADAGQDQQGGARSDDRCALRTADRPARTPRGSRSADGTPTSRSILTDPGHNTPSGRSDKITDESYEPLFAS